MLLHDDVIAEYRDFATYAAGDSPCFEGWALGVIADPEVLAWLDTLPPIKRQPNLVFAAARWHGAPAPGSYDDLRRVLLAREADVRATLMARSTQTNEVGRLATLVPVMALVDGPIALVEVGASAGLCLYPDRYDYAWPPLGELRGSSDHVLTASATGALPIPAAHPEVAWRGGVDLNPLDVVDPDAMAWLENLVWPEQDERRERLDGTPVVFHSAVIAYLVGTERRRFHDLMTDLVTARRCRWISNEGPGVLPGVTGPLAVPPGRFVTALDGVPMAFSHGHGHAVDWLR